VKISHPRRSARWAASEKTGVAGHETASTDAVRAFIVITV
jgi:hypothetical protein